MKARYISVYKVYGANTLPEEAERVALLDLKSPNVTVILTNNPEAHFIHIDLSAAIRLRALGFLALSKESSPQERLAADIEDIKARRAKRTDAGVFLVFDGETDIPTPEFKVRVDTDEFGICLNSFDKSEIRRTFGPSVESVVAALSLALPTNSDRRLDKVGDDVYLIDPDNGKPIYAINSQLGVARLTVASPLTADAISEAAALAPKLSAQKKLVRPMRLLITSLEMKTDDLQAFIAAWAALEIFVEASFKAKYGARWTEMMEDGAPASTKPVFKRIQEVMSDKYRLADKFVVIASVLDAPSASQDATEFRRLKHVRDTLHEGLDTPSSALPTEPIQKLLLKYMRLHLTCAELSGRGLM